MSIENIPKQELYDVIRGRVAELIVKQCDNKQARLAEIAKIPKSAISQFLSGTLNSLNQEHLASLSLNANVNINWLLTGKGPMKNTEKPSISENNAKVQGKGGRIGDSPVQPLPSEQDMWKELHDIRKILMEMEIRLKSIEDTVSPGENTATDEETGTPE